MARTTRSATTGGAPADGVGELVDGVDRHVRRMVEQWPQIDPEVEGIVSRIHDIDRLMHRSGMASLAEAGLTYEDFKVLKSLHDGRRSHGALCRDLMVSTGAMTNRLDKLESAGLVRRERDPGDRRGVLLEITPEGRERLDHYVDIGAGREIELLRELSLDDKRRLNGLLRRLLVSLQAELGPVAQPAASDEDSDS